VIRDSVVLLVEDNKDQAQRIARAMEHLDLPRPVHAPSGEAAVLWVGAHPCDLCLLDYQLPGIDGVETLVRIHQRKPDLPVIMMSNAKSEGVAVAAFRAGVVDYIPKKSDYIEAVARLVRQRVHDLPITEAVIAPSVAGAIPDELLRPTYENRLRVIGRQLDLYEYRAVNLMEIGGGFLVRALPAGASRVPEALEFPDRDFAQVVANAYAARGKGDTRRPSSPLLPSGYEDFLRALGHRLDRGLAEAVTVTELEEFVAVGGVAFADGAFGPFQHIMRPNDIAFLVNEAFQRRAKKGLGFKRMFG